MEFITSAYAQSAVPAYETTGLRFSDWIVIGIGIVIAIISLVVISKNIAVTVGHAIILGAGVALVCLPFVANFEWSDKGFKFARREEASELTDQVVNVAKENLAIREDLKKVSEALQAANLRITALEKPAGSPPPDLQGLNLEQYKGPNFFDDLIRKNDVGIAKGSDSIDQLQNLQRSIQNPQMLKGVQ
ncbi:hypothetical protein [Rhizobium leguminosarum]|uniref:hypothetical protein n=1 Tax=Rhizobium leguminosarum TaxID=384 RepID=UPI001C938E6B|nr:hypothetical protein [Rhizobium leguminosarum]MBY5661094.1 hypothetical protein [Rhizobium leguminosarum]MBY5674451.1 hypothetical protein [Rhizobium leguminosarum]